MAGSGRTDALTVNTIIFDIDGTLVDSMGVDPKLYYSSIEQVLGPVRLRDLNDYDHVTDSGILGQIIQENGFPGADELAAAVKAQFMEALNRHIDDAGSFPVIDGAVQFIDRIRRSTDTRIAIATGCWRESALLKLQTSGFNIEGIPVATSDDSPSRVEIMRSALRMTDCTPGTVTYFGDAEWDQRACDDLGWNFVAVGPRLGGIESFSSIQL
jgi:phosphoglycolate phosphatase-like HAD superfamily hydrolase